MLASWDQPTGPNLFVGLPVRLPVRASRQLTVRRRASKAILRRLPMEAQGTSKEPSTTSWRDTEAREPAGPACSHALCALGRIRTCAPVTNDLLGSKLSSGSVVPTTRRSIPDRPSSM
jgi:hypothetical protein